METNNLNNNISGYFHVLDGTRYVCGCENPDIQYEPAIEFVMCINCCRVISEKDNNIYSEDKYSPRKYMVKVIDKYYSKKHLWKNCNYFKILIMNDIVEKTDKRIIDHTRKKSLDVHYKLYKLSQLCGENIDITEFKIALKTSKAFKEYDTIWNQICALNKWEFIESKWNKS